VPELGISLEELDLATIAEAMDDHDDLTEWWFDPTSGETIPTMDEFVSGRFDDLDTTELVRIEPRSSRAAYLDRVDFAEGIGDASVRERLERALEGRGAFRRFRDAIAAFPDLETPWHEFDRLRSECRALDWLEHERLADTERIADARAQRHARMSEILSVVGGRAPASDDRIAFDRSELADRWDDAVAAIDAGRIVLITDDGAPWARLETDTPDTERRDRR